MSEEATAVESQEQPGVVEFSTKGSEKEGARTIKLTLRVGKDLAEAAELYGDTVVHGLYSKALTIALQANVRRMLEAKNEDGTNKYSDEAIANYVANEYKPGVRAPRAGGKSDVDKAMAMLSKLPEAERAEILKKYGLA